MQIFYDHIYKKQKIIDKLHINFNSLQMDSLYGFASNLLHAVIVHIFSSSEKFNLLFFIKFYINHFFKFKFK